jgi:serine/threonine protein kinase
VAGEDRVLVGRTLKDRYRIYDRLGSGGAATVYLGRDSQSGQMVIVKLVHNHLVNDKFMGRFQREIELLQGLDNPYVVKLYDWALQEFDPELNQALSYIVAEFVEGHTLADIIDTRGPLTEPDALSIGRQVALGLADVHRKGIVHRDIKSQNIMITPDSEAKIIDFGIAKGPGQATLTASSHFAGTLYYAPPEQILEAHGVDHRADIYALGVVLYEMLTATLPVKAREFGTVASRIISGKLDPITGVSEPVGTLVTQMMALKPEQRPTSTKEVALKIEKILGQRQPAASLLDMEIPATTASMRPIKLQEEESTKVMQQQFELVAPNGKRAALTMHETVIGRSHPRDTVTPDIDLWTMGVEDARTASRRHCRIFYEGGRYNLEDLGSMNGTFLNEIQIYPGDVHPLKDGDRIAAGRVVMTFRRAAF